MAVRRTRCGFSLALAAFSVACAAHADPRGFDPRRADARNKPGAQLCHATSEPLADTTVYDAAQVDVKPAVATGPNIDYPDRLRQEGIQGRVVYSLIVNPNGSAELGSIRVVGPSVYREFQEAGLRYLELATFLPACIAGRAVRVRDTLPIDWKIRR